MSVSRISVVMLATALMSAAGGVAHAADKVSKPLDFTVKAEPITVAPNGGKAFVYDASRGRVGFTLGIQQPVGRQMAPNDVQAGAYFRITPSIKVGGSVALGQQELTPRPNSARPADAPKVRLESSFKF